MKKSVMSLVEMAIKSNKLSQVIALLNNNKDVTAEGEEEDEKVKRVDSDRSTEVVGMSSCDYNNQVTNHTNLESMVVTVEAAAKSTGLSQAIALLQQEMIKSLFSEAVKANEVDQVNYMLTSKQVDVNTPEKIDDDDVDNRTALMYAAELGYAEMVRNLLDHGAFSSLESSFGDFLHSLALENNHNQVAKILFKVAPDTHISRVYNALGQNYIQYLNEIKR
jgi:ankyrin repeat protein